jgi:hypothetical protein
MFRRLQLCAILGIALGLALVPLPARAWGRSANRLILNRAIDTLPPELRQFFDANRATLLKHVNDPFENLEKQSADHKNQFLYLEKYGRFPFDALPRSYRAAVAKFGKSKLESNGLLPWQIGVYSQKLTEAMREGKWEEAKMNAAILANYVAAAHDPFNTTDNFDGHLSGQRGVNDRFGTTLIDRYSSFFFMRPNDAVFIADPTDHAFDACLSAHSWLESILLADRDSRRGLNSYTDEYYDHFYNQSGAVLIRQISDAATDVGSFWFTAWKNAGQPQLPR